MKTLSFLAMNLRRFRKVFLWVVIIAVVLVSSVILVAYFKQDAIVQSQITSLNKGYSGRISVGDVHLAPFANFPDISLKVDDVHIYEGKRKDFPPIVEVADIYVGFNLWDVLIGNYDIHSLLVEDGFIDIVLHPDGRTNIENALSVSEESDDGEAIEIHLYKIEFRNIDIHQREEATNLDIETLIHWAKGGFKTHDNEIAAHVDSEFELNVIDDGDTTYLKHKHFEFHTDLVFHQESGMIIFEPSGITMEHGDFLLEGSIDTRNEMTLAIDVKGTKPSFDMFIAFAPEEIIPVLERYENAGKIYFNARVEGPTTNGRQPFIDAEFGAEEAFLENSSVKRRIDHMGFAGHFTNGEKRNLETMEFSLSNMAGDLEEGRFIGNIFVKNFLAPEIDMELDADFEIPFAVSFLNLSEIKDPAGSVVMKLKFHDVIDLDNPQNALNDLDQAYFAELNVKDLSFQTDDLPALLEDLDIHLIMNGKEARMDELNLKMGKSDLSVSGFLSDLPAIVHHTAVPVKAHLEIRSQHLDVAELTNYSTEDSTGVDEQIDNLSLAFSFDALGNAFTEYKHLPIGEFYIDDLYADLKHYPHTLHDFHADVLVKDKDLKIVDFTGFIDESDFHFNGLIHDYSFLTTDELNGKVNFDIRLTSKLLKFENLFSYRGENYVPEDYRHEEIEDLDLHLGSSLVYSSDSMQSFDIRLDNLSGKMHVHPLRFEDFSGRFHFSDEHLIVQGFRGKMGRTDFLLDLNYYLGENPEIRKRDNALHLQADFIDFDALSSFNLEDPLEDSVQHDEAFNIYELPFTDMQFNAEIGHFIYHRLDLQNIEAQLRTTRNHHLHVDTLSLNGAGGHIGMKGTFNGSNPDKIYLQPHLSVKGVDLDQLLFKFENFGQDAIVSENLHGKLNTEISGNIRMYPDMVADIDQSEIHLDLMVLDGRLVNYKPAMALSDFFGDKNLSNIRFDTLQNHMDISEGVISIPNMTIESTLGHMDISGTQDMNDNIDYYFRIPWSMVKQVARNKLFGSKPSKQQEDEIIEVDPRKKVRYLNVNVTGTFDDYKIKMKKARKP